MDTTQERLRQLLSAAKINHKCTIMQQPTLHAAHIYCKIHKLSGQTTGGLLEAYICRQYNMVKNKASLCAGDATHMGVNIEIKTSCGGHNHNKFNYVQIRTHQNCDYMLTAYYLHKSNVDQLGELFVFYLTKCNMIDILCVHGSYAHGTISKLGRITAADLHSPDNTKEYALRPKYNDACWRDLLRFHRNELDVQLNEFATPNRVLSSCVEADSVI